MLNIPVNNIYRNGVNLNYQSMHDYSKDYLTMKVLSGGTIRWWHGNYVGNMHILYSKDNGTTWTLISSVTGAGNSISVSAGDKVLFKGNNERYMASGKTINSYGSSFKITGCTVDIEGNIMSMTHGDNFTAATSVASYAFSYLFDQCSGITNARNLVLPATTLGENCYYGMFSNCLGLTKAPVLPATTLATNCYNKMFWSCWSLTSTPELPATTLAAGCYQDLFGYCTGLTSAPVLPATALEDSCYRGMFQSCTSLTTAPELPVTILANNCYRYMFNSCVGLKYIKCLATNPDAAYTQNWVQGVASSGTFVKAAGASWPTGDSGIPSGWTVQEV